ncbi:MAG: SMP-30/gluconolactonase/LRE family protein [Bacteroidota bacterium]
MRPILMTLFTLLFACQNTSEPSEKETTNTPKHKTIGSIELLDDRLNELIAPDAKIEILAEGFNWSEGPVWVEEIESLLFSDVPENKIWRWSETDSLRLYIEPSGRTGALRENDKESGSNGLILNDKGKLVVCQHGDRRVAKLTASFDDPSASFETLADDFEGRKFNSPNDLVFDGGGNCYFTDPPYGLPLKMDDPTKEIEFQGVYRINTDSSVDLLTDELTRPNGIELSNDEKTLYVANSDPDRAIWTAFDLQEDGTLANARIFYDATNLVGDENEKGLPDGLVVADNNVIYATGPGGVWIFDEMGKALGKIRTTVPTANCTIDPKRNVLYITADMYLLRVLLR